MEEVGPRLEQRTKAAQEQLPDAQERSLLALTTCFRASLAPGVGYRIPPLTAKRPPRHFRPRRRLPPLPLADHHQTHDPEIGRATSELQSLMRISYAVFCLKKKTTAIHLHPTYHHLHATRPRPTNHITHMTSPSITRTTD